MFKLEYLAFWFLNILYGYSAAYVAHNISVPFHMFSMGIIGLTLLTFAWDIVYYEEHSITARS